MRYVSLLTILLITMNAFASDSSAPEAAPNSASPPTSMTLCSDMVVSGNPKLTPTPTVNPLSTLPATCISVPGGGVGWGGVIIFVIAVGGAFEPSCPSDYPYLSSFEEVWAGAFTAGGGAGMTATCCDVPNTTTMSIQTGYKTGSGSYNTWQEGPDCN